MMKGSHGDRTPPGLEVWRVMHCGARGGGEPERQTGLNCSEHATNHQPLRDTCRKTRVSNVRLWIWMQLERFENRPEYEIRQREGRGINKPLNSHLTGNGGVSGHSRRDVVVAVRAVEERLSPLAVDKVGLQDEGRARAGDGVQGAAARRRRAIVHVEAAREKHRRHRGREAEVKESPGKMRVPDDAKVQFVHEMSQVGWMLPRTRHTCTCGKRSKRVCLGADSGDCG